MDQSAVQPVAQSPAAWSPLESSSDWSASQGAVQPAGFAFVTGQPNKVHHSYIWLGSLVAFGAVVAVAAVTNIQDLVSLAVYLGGVNVNVLLVIGLALVALLVAYGIVVGIYALAYRNLRFVFDEQEFSLYSGIVTKRRVHVPYERVQSVNHRQSLVQRLAGVCTVEVDTAGGASNKAVKVPYVLLGTGEAMRSDLFARKAVRLGIQTPSVIAQMPTGQSRTVYGQPGDPAGNLLDAAASQLGVDGFRGVFGTAMPGMEPVSFERRLGNGELALASVSSSSVTALAVTMLATVAITVLSLYLVEPTFAMLGLLLVPLSFGVLLLLVALSIGAVALSYGNFVVRRRGSRIEVERGILQREFSGIDVSRVQSVTVRQSLLRRLFGYCEVSLGRINAVAERKQGNQAKLNNGALVIHPFVKLNQVDGLIAGLLPEFTDRPASDSLVSLPPVALRRGIIRRCILRNPAFWLAVAVALFQLLWNGALASLSPADAAILTDVNRAVFLACIVCYVACAVSTVLAAVGTVWWKRGSGFAATSRYLAVRNDGLNTDYTVVPRSKIQYGALRTNPFQRKADTATIYAKTAAGAGSGTVRLWDVRAQDAATYLSWLQPHH